MSTCNEEVDVLIFLKITSNEKAKWQTFFFFSFSIAQRFWKMHKNHWGKNVYPFCMVATFAVPSNILKEKNKINKTKSWYFQKINKIDSSLPRVINK